MTETLPGPGGLSISSSIAAGTGFLALRGELDLAGAPLLERNLLEIERQAPDRLVIDLRDLQFIDSTGLRLLLAANSRAQERGGELVLRPGGILQLDAGTPHSVAADVDAKLLLCILK